MTLHAWKDYLPGSGHAFCEDLQGISEEQERAVVSGVELGKPLPRPTAARLSEGAVGDVIGTVWMGYIVSSDLRSTLEEVSAARLQFVRVRVPEHARREFFLLNLLESVDCFDRERSDYDTVPGHPDVVLTLRKLALRPLPDPVPDLFHVAGLPGLILIDDDVRDSLTSSCPAPGRFVDVAAYTRGFS